MRILALGDITDPRAIPYLSERLWGIRREHKIDMVIANGENAGFIFGPTPDQAREILGMGVDVVTGGNHTLQNKYLHGMLEHEPRLLRPANYPGRVPGHGYTIVDVLGYKVLVMNVLGRIHMEPPLDSPIHAIERILRREEGNYDLSVLDIHAEATGEKGILASYFDGRISVIFGTHTHVQTADERILPKGSGFLTDLGMCGLCDGVLGIDAACVIEKYCTGISCKYIPSQGTEIQAHGAIFTVEEATKHTVQVERIRF